MFPKVIRDLTLGVLMSYNLVFWMKTINKTQNRWMLTALSLIFQLRQTHLKKSWRSIQNVKQLELGILQDWCFRPPNLPSRECESAQRARLQTTIWSNQTSFLNALQIWDISATWTAEEQYSSKKNRWVFPW